MKISHRLALAALLATGWGAGPIGAAAADPVTLKFSADMPATGVMFVGYIKPWLDRVAAASQGTLKFETYTDGVMSKNGDTVNRVGAGVADLGWDLPLVYGARFADLGLTGLPGLISADAGDAGAAMWRAYEKGAIGKGFGADVKPLFILATPQFSFFMKEPLKDNGDLTGLKIATVAKEQAEIVQGMGGVPVALPTAEHYQAIQKGVVDGVFSSVGQIYSFKINELTHYYLFGPFGGGTVVVVMNKKSYEALPAAAKKAIDDTTGEKGSRDISAYLYKAESDYMQIMLKDPKNKQVFIQPADLAKWKKAFDPITIKWLAATTGGDAAIAEMKAQLAAK